MTNKEWLNSLDDFEKAVVITNFARNYTEFQKQKGLKDWRKWLDQEIIINKEENNNDK